jgi:hypothetical protein
MVAVKSPEALMVERIVPVRPHDQEDHLAQHDVPRQVESVQQPPTSAAPGEQKRVQKQQHAREQGHGLVKAKQHVEAERPLHPSGPGGQDDLQQEDRKRDQPGLQAEAVDVRTTRSAPQERHQNHRRENPQHVQGDPQKPRSSG